MQTYIIATSGKKNAGKNTIANDIEKYFRDKFFYCKIQQYSFADLLKRFCIEVLDLPEHLCYGTDDDKNTPTQYRWENLPQYVREQFTNKTGLMTIRDVLQIFGTQCVRDFFGSVWAKATIRRIKADMITQNLKLALITDNRFPDEVQAVLDEVNGYIIRLTRSPFADDKHLSETALDNFDWSSRDRCFVLDNKAIGIDEQSNIVKGILEQITV